MKGTFLILILTLGVVFSCSPGTKTNEVSQPEPIEARPTAPKEDPAIDELRTEWQNPDLVLSLLGDLSGKTIADIGAGSGYFSFKLAKNAQKVIALDVDPNALEYIKEQKNVVGDWSSNIEVRLTPPDVPNLLPEEADKVLIVNTYSFLPDKIKYLVRLRDGMKDGAQLVIIDFKAGDMPVGPSETFKQDPVDVVAALRAINLKDIKVDMERLQYQYIITAKK
jgi:SAM-dependent methyltransferase